MSGIRPVLILVCLAGGASSAFACGLDVVGTASLDASTATTSATDAAPRDATTPSADAADAAPAATSCKSLLARDPSRLGQSGIYPIQPDGREAGAPLEVYCEMSIDQGGWTLAGRSVQNGQPPFGWRSAAGSVRDLTLPYSLDVRSSRLLFSEVLIADRAQASLDAGTRAFKFPVAPDFLNAHATDLTRTAAVHVFGDCKPTPAPSMFNYAGATSITDAFFLRDVESSADHYGLKPEGWRLAYQNCSQGASLDGRQGLIFVR